ncbi:MAG TPA: multicopper oxidase domain-containing protein [Rhizomicrobium sp.]
MSKVLRTLLLVFAMAPALPALAFADDNICSRPGVGEVVKTPPDLYSSNGVLAVSLNYFTSLDKLNRTRFCFVTPDGKESPTLHVLPGDTIQIALTNMVSQQAEGGSYDSEVVSNDRTRCGAKNMTLSSVNIHFHGTNTSPKCHSDDVIHTLVNSGETFTYNVKIPTDEPPGLYWYHPHVHGISAAAVNGGASGAIIVEGIAKFQPAVKGLPQRLLIIRDESLAHPPKLNKGAPNAPFWDISLNYVPIAYPRYIPSIIKMHAGAQEFWRVVNASADSITDVQLQYDGVAQPLQIVGFDGVPTGSQDGKHKGSIITQTDILIPPAGRAEFIVTGPTSTVTNATLYTLGIASGPAGDSLPKRPLAKIETTTDPHWLPAVVERTSPYNGDRFANLADAKVTAHRTLYFSEVQIRAHYPPGGHDAKLKRVPGGGGVEFFITVDGQQPTLYNVQNPPAIVTHKGAVEDWTIQNRSPEHHEFHMHQIHYLLMAINGVPVPKDQQQFYDTYQVPYWTGTGPYPSITVRMDFRGAVVGEFVYHCHILDHEDGGMMANIRVLPKGPPPTGPN